MGRIRQACEGRFRALLAQVRARRIEQGVRWLAAKAQQLAEREHLLPAEALTLVYRELLGRLHRYRRRPLGPAANVPTRPATPPHFLCDAGLGGLARWLRAAGYEAVWIPGITDDELLLQAQRLGAVVLTTDSGLLERRLLRDGRVPHLWLPPALRSAGQLALVLRELGLGLRPPRCMSCGGELRRVPKETVRDRIPPKTWCWQDEYHLCTRCDKLFWHGTHWQRIRASLEQSVT